MVSLVEPGPYNAAEDLIGRNLRAGRGNKTAFVDDRGACSYAELDARSNRFANTLRALGVHPEQRILLCLLDTIEFPVAFLGAIKAGVVPVPVNTLLTSDDYAFMIADSRARAILVSAPLLLTVEAALGMLPGPHPTVIVAGESEGVGRHRAFADLLGEADADPRPI